MEKNVTKKKKKPGAESNPVPHWPEMIAVFFDFCRSKFGVKPSFDNSAPRNLKSIVLSLKSRAEDGGIVWDLKTASERLGNFLEIAYTDSWLKDNFLLQNLDRQKDKIFFKRDRNNSNGQKSNSKTDGIEYAISQATRREE